MLRRHARCIDVFIEGLTNPLTECILPILAARYTDNLQAVRQTAPNVQLIECRVQFSESQIAIAAYNEHVTNHNIPLPDGLPAWPTNKRVAGAGGQQNLAAPPFCATRQGSDGRYWTETGGNTGSSPNISMVGRSGLKAIWHASQVSTSSSPARRIRVWSRARAELTARRPASLSCWANLPQAGSATHSSSSGPVPGNCNSPPPIWIWYARRSTSRHSASVAG